VSASASAAARLRGASLSIKLAALGGAVTAAVVWAAFWGLSVETRASTTAAYTAQLERNQRTLGQLQERRARELLFTASLVSQAPDFQYSLKQFQVEANRGATPNPSYLVEIDRHAQRLAQNSRADLLVITDDSGRVFSTGGARVGLLPRGARLSSLPAVNHALDANAPADSGGVAVLETDAGYFQVAVFPLVQDGFTLGALILGHRLDSTFVRDAASAADADVIVTAGPRTVSASTHALTGANLVSKLGAGVRTSGASTLMLGDEEFVVAPVKLGETQRREAVQLWMLQPLSRRVTELMDPLRRDFLVYGTLAVLVAAVGIAIVARTVLAPFTRFVAYMRSGAAADQRQGRFDADREAIEVRTLNDSFNQLMDSIGVKRRALEERTAELASANVVLTDEINERIRVEQALRESEAQLRQSQKLEAIGTLAGGIAHDFNNLITVISGYTQLVLMRAEKGSPLVDDLRQVIEASDRASTLTHQLLAFSRKQVLQSTVLDLGEVVNGISPMLRRIIGEHILLSVESIGPLARVRADRGQLEQVLLNLAVNARDAMSGGGSLTISTSNERDAAGQPTAVCLAVTDTGIGMPADVRERIFEPFFTTKEVGKGTGLGLTVAYAIVQEHGGRITLKSEPSGGATFAVELPADASGLPRLPPPAKEALVPAVSGVAVLVVEDEAALGAAVAESLQDSGFTVDRASDGLEALERLRAKTYDLIICDLKMPRLDGTQFYHELELTRPQMARRIMFVTGDVAGTEAERFLEESGCRWLAKPFRLKDLLRAAREMVA